MKNKLSNSYTSKAAKFALAPVVLLGSLATSQAVPDAAITEMITDAGTIFTSVQGLVITVVAFGIFIAFVKKVKSR
jgi:hypothetical protein